MTKITFVKLCHLASGHRIFRAHCPGFPEHDRLAIADKSGQTPSETEDGILWLMPDRGVHVTLSGRKDLVTHLDVHGPRCGTPHNPSHVWIYVEDLAALAHVDPGFGKIHVSDAAAKRLEVLRETLAMIDASHVIARQSAKGDMPCGA